MLGIQALTGLPSLELPQDSESLEQVWNDLKIEADPQLKHVLGRMISYQYKQRFPDAVEALKALIPTEIKPPESSSHSSHNLIAKKLLLALLGVTSLAGVGIIGERFLDRPNYAQLETYLQNQDWQQADAETDKLMLQVAGEKSALDADAINKFPCKSLEKIDELWTSNSGGRFGFTPQEKAYLETGNEFNQYTQATSEAFGDRVKRNQDVARLTPKILNLSDDEREELQKLRDRHNTPKQNWKIIRRGRIKTPAESLLVNPPPCGRRI